LRAENDYCGRAPGMQLDIVAFDFWEKRRLAMANFTITHNFNFINLNQNAVLDMRYRFINRSYYFTINRCYYFTGKNISK